MKRIAARSTVPLFQEIHFHECGEMDEKFLELAKQYIALRDWQERMLMRTIGGYGSRKLTAEEIIEIRSEK